MLMLHRLNMLGNRHGILCVAINAIDYDVIESWEMARTARVEPCVRSILAWVASTGLESTRRTERRATAWLVSPAALLVPKYEPRPKYAFRLWAARPSTARDAPGCLVADLVGWHREPR
jgi:hypothetical protein